MANIIKVRKQNELNYYEIKINKLTLQNLLNIKVVLQRKLLGLYRYD
jgi:hypothetical protein